MKSLIREFVAGIAAILMLAASASVDGIPLFVSFFASVCVYLGCRLLLPIVEPVESTNDQITLRTASRAIVNRLCERTANFRGESLRRELVGLTDVLTKLLDRASLRQDQKDIDSEFPERIKELDTLLEKYSVIASVDNLSDSARSALTHTEEVIARTRRTFEDVFRRQVDADAIDLKVDARVYEELMDTHIRLDEMRAQE